MAEFWQELKTLSERSCHKQYFVMFNLLSD